MEKLSTKQMLIDIASMRRHALSLMQNEKDYKVILKAITDKDYYYDDSLSFP